MSNALEKADRIQTVAELSMKGKRPSDIAKELGVSPDTVRADLREYEDYIKVQAKENPEVFDRVIENTLKFLENYDLMLKEAWDLHNDAKELNIAVTRLQSLKLIHELTSQKAKFYQLLGPRPEGNYMDKIKKVERVNEMLSGVLRNTVRECPRCRDRVLQDLAVIMQEGSDEEIIDVEALPAQT